VGTAGGADAAVFFGRDTQILRGLDMLYGMRTNGVESLFVILGPSGAGKSSFLWCSSSNVITEMNSFS
jgi:ABC-type multidrug transport system ATPase subunit